MAKKIEPLEFLYEQLLNKNSSFKINYKKRFEHLYLNNKK